MEAVGHYLVEILESNASCAIIQEALDRQVESVAVLTAIDLWSAVGAVHRDDFALVFLSFGCCVAWQVLEDSDVNGRLLELDDAAVDVADEGALEVLGDRERPDCSDVLRYLVGQSLGGDIVSLHCLGLVFGRKQLPRLLEILSSLFIQAKELNRHVEPLKQSQVDLRAGAVEHLLEVNDIVQVYEFDIVDVGHIDRCWELVTFRRVDECSEENLSEFQELAQECCRDLGGVLFLFDGDLSRVLGLPFLERVLEAVPFLVPGVFVTVPAESILKAFDHFELAFWAARGTPEGMEPGLGLIIPSEVHVADHGFEMTELIFRIDQLLRIEEELADHVDVGLPILFISRQAEFTWPRDAQLLHVDLELLFKPTLFLLLEHQRKHVVLFQLIRHPDQRPAVFLRLHREVSGNLDKQLRNLLVIGLDDLGNEEVIAGISAVERVPQFLHQCLARFHLVLKMLKVVVGAPQIELLVGDYSQGAYLLKLDILEAFVDHERLPEAQFLKRHV